MIAVVVSHRMWTIYYKTNEKGRAMMTLPWICDKGLLVSGSFTSSISHKFSIIGSKPLGI